MSDIHLESQTLEAVFSESTGALIRLTSKRTGWDVQARGELGLSFRALVPQLDRRNNPVRGEKQALAGCHIDPDGTGLELTWTDLESEHGGVLAISFRGSVTLSDDGLTFEGEVENNSPYVVETVSWPCLGDLSVPAGCEHLARMNLVIHGDMEVEPLRPTFRTTAGYFGTDNPIQMVPTPTSPFVLIDNGRQGLYTGYHDITSEQLVQFTWELKPGFEHMEQWRTGTVPRAEQMAGQPVRIEFYTTHFPFLQPGETGALHPIVLLPYVGSWHRGVDCYKKWRETWFRPPPSPEWARQVHSWQQIHINSPEDDLLCRYEDLVKYGEDCARHGVAAIQLTGWTVGGQDRGNPSHDSEPRLGTRKQLRDAIAAIQAMGVRVVLFNKYTWSDVSQEWFRRELVRHAAKDPYGDFLVFPGYRYQTPTSLSDINTRRLVPMCAISADWRAIATSEFEKVLDLGADGMLYDECHHHGDIYRYCFDPDHGHHVPAHMFSGDGPLAEGFRSAAAKQTPDYLFAGEDCYDLQLRHYSISYYRIGLGHTPLHRYIDSETGIMIAVVGYNDRHTINQALLFRYIICYEPRFFKGRLDEFPETLEYGKRVDGLRKRYSQYLWDAEFRDTLGATVTTEGQPHGDFSVFVDRPSGKRAVVVANSDRNEHAHVRVEIEESTSPVMSATPEAPELVRSDGTAQLAPLSAVVFIEDK